MSLDVGGVQHPAVDGAHRQPAEKPCGQGFRVATPTAEGSTTTTAAIGSRSASASMRTASVSPSTRRPAATTRLSRAPGVPEQAQPAEEQQLGQRLAVRGPHRVRLGVGQRQRGRRERCSPRPDGAGHERREGEQREGTDHGVGAQQPRETADPVRRRECQRQAGHELRLQRAVGGAVERRAAVGEVRQVTENACLGGDLHRAVLGDPRPISPSGPGSLRTTRFSDACAQPTPGERPRPPGSARAPTADRPAAAGRVRGAAAAAPPARRAARGIAVQGWNACASSRATPAVIQAAHDERRQHPVRVEPPPGWLALRLRHASIQPGAAG